MFFRVSRKQLELVKAVEVATRNAAGFLPVHGRLKRSADVLRSLDLITIHETAGGPVASLTRRGFDMLMNDQLRAL